MINLNDSNNYDWWNLNDSIIRYVNEKYDKNIQVLIDDNDLYIENLDVNKIGSEVWKVLVDNKEPVDPICNLIKEFNKDYIGNSDISNAIGTAHRYRTFNKPSVRKLFENYFNELSE
jgi:hypothetical protein